MSLCRPSLKRARTRQKLETRPAQQKGLYRQNIQAFRRKSQHRTPCSRMHWMRCQKRQNVTRMPHLAHQPLLQRQRAIHSI